MSFVPFCALTVLYYLHHCSLVSPIFGPFNGIVFCLVMLCFDIITRSCCYDNIYINIAGVFRSFNMHIKFYDAQFVLQKQNYWRCCTRMFINDDLKVLKWVWNECLWLYTSIHVVFHENCAKNDGTGTKCCLDWIMRKFPGVQKITKTSSNHPFKWKSCIKYLLTIIKMFIFILYHHHQ